MTYPGSGSDGEPRPDERHAGGWPRPGAQPPQYPREQYPQQNYGQPPYGAPQQGTQPYGGQQYGGQPYGGQPYGGQQYGQQYGQQPYGAPPFGGPTGYATQQHQQPKRRQTGRVVGVLAAVLVLVGGGIGAWIAFSGSAPTGSASPQAAATKLVADISNGDVLGLVNDLPPGESGLFRDTLTASNDQLKRMQILRPDANSGQTSGLVFSASNLAFDNAAVENVNDHIAITKLVAGTLTVGSDIAKSAYTEQFLHSAFPDGVPNAKTHTIDVATAVRQLGHPIRVATVRVNGTWYPSLFYSITDAALQSRHQNWPAKAIPANGAASADDAVRQFAKALLDSDFRGAIALTSPDEMGALHDAGQAILDAVHGARPSGVRIDDIRLHDRSVPGGTDAVLDSITVEKDGQRITFARSNGCYTVSDAATGRQQRLCVADLIKRFSSGQGAGLPPALSTFLQHMVTGLLDTGVGMVATQANGSWYVSPVRTFTQLGLDMTKNIQPDDLRALLQLGNH